MLYHVVCFGAWELVCEIQYIETGFSSIYPEPCKLHAWIIQVDYCRGGVLILYGLWTEINVFMFFVPVTANFHLLHVFVRTVSGRHETQESQVHIFLYMLWIRYQLYPVLFWWIRHQLLRIGRKANERLLVLQKFNCLGALDLLKNLGGRIFDQDLHTERQLQNTQQWQCGQFGEPCCKFCKPCLR